jgi:hypothetical protein
MVQTSAMMMSDIKVDQYDAEVAVLHRSAYISKAVI